MKAFWKLIGDIRLSFWLLMLITATLVAGGVCGALDFDFVENMNGLPVQQWYLNQGIHHPFKSSWVVLLFLFFSLFGINITACSIDRIVSLFPSRNKYSFAAFFHLLTPSLVHIVFFLILLGHLFTFTTGRQERIPLNEGGILALPGGAQHRVVSIENTRYPEGTLLAGRTAQTKVRLESVTDTNRSMTVLFGDFIRAGGAYLHLDMLKKGGKFAPRAPRIEQTLDKSCNKEHLFRDRPKVDSGAQLFLLVTFDPGLPLIVTGFTLMIALLAFYYIRGKAVK